MKKICTKSVTLFAGCVVIATGAIVLCSFLWATTPLAITQQQSTRPQSPKEVPGSALYHGLPVGREELRTLLLDKQRRLSREEKARLIRVAYNEGRLRISNEIRSNNNGYYVMNALLGSFPGEWEDQDCGFVYFEFPACVILIGWRDYSEPPSTYHLRVVDTFGAPVRFLDTTHALVSAENTSDGGENEYGSWKSFSTLDLTDGTVKTLIEDTSRYVKLPYWNPGGVIYDQDTVSPPPYRTFGGRTFLGSRTIQWNNQVIQFTLVQGASHKDDKVIVTAGEKDTDPILLQTTIPAKEGKWAKIADIDLDALIQDPTHLQAKIGKTSYTFVVKNEKMTLVK